MRSLKIPALLLLSGLAAAVARPAAAQLVADLSSHLVAITTGFTGANLLLFGATQGKGDVVVVIRGPAQTVVVRRKGRVAGVWVNEAQMTFREVPSYYLVAASQPLGAIVPEGAGARHQIGLDHLRMVAEEGADPAVVREFREALIRNMQQVKLYSKQPASIAFLGNRLFRVDVHFPTNAQVGTYTVSVFLFREGEVVGAEITPLVVSKVGFEARVFDFANRHSLAYGVLAIVLAVVAGWSASIVFRKG